MPRRPLPLGRTLATSGALAVLEQLGMSPADLLRRHEVGDWGDLCPEDIDANEQSSGNQAFELIGRAEFSAPGQLQVYQAGGHTFIEANTTDATPGAELRIVLEQPISLRDGDFLM